MNLVEIAVGVLHDAKHYLNRIDQTKYNESIELLSGSSIGGHTRHFIEFFQCLLEQKTQQIQVNYDLRPRNSEIEKYPNKANESIEKIIKDLNQHTWQEDCHIAAEYNPDTNEKVCIHTSFGRELMYNIEHTIHHLALIKIGLKLIVPEMELPSHFGIAPSTIKFNKTQLAKTDVEKMVANH